MPKISFCLSFSAKSAQNQVYQVFGAKSAKNQFCQYVATLTTHLGLPQVVCGIHHDQTLQLSSTNVEFTSGDSSEVIANKSKNHSTKVKIKKMENLRFQTFTECQRTINSHSIYSVKVILRQQGNF